MAPPARPRRRRLRPYTTGRRPRATRMTRETPSTGSLRKSEKVIGHEWTQIDTNNTRRFYLCPFVANHSSPRQRVIPIPRLRFHPHPVHLYFKFVKRAVFHTARRREADAVLMPHLIADLGED